MSRHSHSNNNSEFELQFQVGAQQPQMTPYQNEMYGMPPSQARHCHHRMMGQSNENVYNNLPQVGFNYGYPENQSNTSNYQQDYNSRWQQDYAAAQARYQNQGQGQEQCNSSQEQMYARMQQQQLAYERHNQQYNSPPPEMYARMQAQEQAYAMHNQQYGNPQQNYYAPSNFNPQQHRGGHCHRHHPRHHYGQQLGGQQQSSGLPYYNGEGQQPYQNNGQQQYRDTQYDPRTYDGATYQAQDARQNAQIVAQVARSMGVDPVVAIAAMLVESGGNAQAVGDHGSSFGLFQLHKHGELGNMSPQQAFNPVQNAQVALSHFQRGQQSNPGMMVANAQRPADRSTYAAKVNARLGQAQQLLNEVGMA